MPFAKDVQEVVGTSLRPWERSLLLSLFDMIDFAAETFFRISALLKKFEMHPEAGHSQKEMNELFDYIKATVNHCGILGMSLSVNKAVEIMNMLVTGQANPERLSHGVQELHSRMCEELRAELFKYVPRHRAHYADPYNFQTPELTNFGWITVCEFQKAGECLAFGQNTACAFHLFRIVDAGLKATAKSLTIDSYDGNWRSVSTKIENEMKKKYEDKTTDWKDAEPFYAGILTDILAISKARNRTLHDFKTTYIEEEVQRLFTIVEGFIRHLSAGGLQEP